MSKLTISQLLASPVRNTTQISQSNDRSDIAKYWCNKYAEKIGRKDVLMIKDRVNIKRLVEIYGAEKLKKLIDFYIGNYQLLTYVQGKPSISALMFFRKRIEDSMDKTHVGQYSEDKMSCNNWI